MDIVPLYRSKKSTGERLTLEPKKLAIERAGNGLRKRCVPRARRTMRPERFIKWSGVLAADGAGLADGKSWHRLKPA